MIEFTKIYISEQCNEKLGEIDMTSFLTINAKLCLTLTHISQRYSNLAKCWSKLLKCKSISGDIKIF